MPALRRLGLVAVLAALFAAGPLAADQKDKRLAPLFAELAAAKSPAEGDALSDRIWQIWLEAPDARAAALLAEGITAMNGAAYDTALAAFDKLVVAAPDFAEGWNRRATLLYMMDDLNGSVRDIEHVLALEPRHFGALSGLGLIYMKLGDDEAALKAFRRALAIDPYLAGDKENVQTLEKRLKDHAI